MHSVWRNDMSRETGGTVRVEGTIKFQYEVHTRDCNVFSPEELVRLIDEDKIGYFIDMYLGCGMVPNEGEDAERYEVLDFKAVEYIDGDASEKNAKVETHTVTITDRYEVPDGL
jgi:hypothetical protein